MAAVRLAAFRVRNSDTWCNRFFPNFTILHAPSAVQLYTASSWKWLLLYAAVFFVETGHPLLLAASAIPSVGRVHICSFVLFFFFARLWFLGLAHFCCWLHPCLPACLPAVGSFLPAGSSIFSSWLQLSSKVWCISSLRPARAAEEAGTHAFVSLGLARLLHV